MVDHLAEEMEVAVLQRQLHLLALHLRMAQSMVSVKQPSMLLVRRTALRPSTLGALIQGKTPKVRSRVDSEFQLLQLLRWWNSTS